MTPLDELEKLLLVAGIQAARRGDPAELVGEFFTAGLLDGLCFVRYDRDIGGGYYIGLPKPALYDILRVQGQDAARLAETLQ